MSADSVRPKHVDALVQQWKADGVSTGTMKNRMSVGRWRRSTKLKDTWTKGGKYREIAICTPEQRTVLNKAKRLAAGRSLIPSDLRYRDQLQRVRAQCDKAGIHGVHGLRHRYAQDRYQQLTGWQSPARGGARSAELSQEQKQKDLSARLLLAENWDMAENKSRQFIWAVSA